MVKKLIALLPLSLLLTGCASTTITNLTSRELQRAPNGLYMIEAKLDSRQQSMRWETIRPTVIIDSNSYTMTPTMLMTNRWETLIPIPASQSVVYYRLRFDYDYNAFGSPPKADSKLSQAYRLQIFDK